MLEESEKLDAKKEGNNYNLPHRLDASSDSEESSRAYHHACNPTVLRKQYLNVHSVDGIDWRTVEWLEEIIFFASNIEVNGNLDNHPLVLLEVQVPGPSFGYKTYRLGLTGNRDTVIHFVKIFTIDHRSGPSLLLMGYMHMDLTTFGECFHDGLFFDPPLFSTDHPTHSHISQPPPILLMHVHRSSLGDRKATTMSLIFGSILPHYTNRSHEKVHGHVHKVTVTLAG